MHDERSRCQPRALTTACSKAYLRIRGGAKNGMAVVPIERDASAGSYIKIPPQRILDVGARKRIIVDEHSGRILVDEELAMEESEKMKKAVKKKLTCQGQGLSLF